MFQCDAARQHWQDYLYAVSVANPLLGRAAPETLRLGQLRDWAQVVQAEPSSGDVPEHPAGQSDATKQYVELVVAHLRAKGGKHSMSKIGIDVKRPEGANKIGKVLKGYPDWFRRSGDKGAPDVT